MANHANMLAVQVSSVHHRMPDRGGAWQMVLLFIGVALVCWGGARLLRLRRWRAEARTTQGRVVDHVARARSQRDRARLAVIEFMADGATFVLPGDQAPPSRRWPVGQTVDVLYDRSDPRRAGLAGEWIPLPWALVTGLAIVGLFVVAISV